MNRIIGIDPGLHGAIAVLDVDDWTLDVIDVPIYEVPMSGKTKGGKSKTKNVVDFASLARAMTMADYNANVSMVFIERVSAMPGQGVASMFNFGQVYGALQMSAFAARLPVTLITPQSWKKVMKLDSQKDAARAKASMLMPACSSMWRLKKHDGRAEAALIAHHGASSLGFAPKKPIVLADTFSMSEPAA